MTELEDDEEDVKKGDKKKASPSKRQNQKRVLSRSEEEEDEVDLVAKMDEAKRAMPNALVVSHHFHNYNPPPLPPRGL